ncbi:uncharacterized protein BYT42DRAFT_327946 [Radiomyces spectabilis]|uniref:uncharacterized protein n=1 Tax=Radiomyces spectabilis TaxID=64574 RepID=UPI00221F00B6|nr:uncharacterized protein BYT42DRAFT_327946 [Radiomyces spectabilis]KAI8379458.1 hypothetical protein BYT42DRAFT_327946 [Radiomyces spectabilis]
MAAGLLNHPTPQLRFADAFWDNDDHGVDVVSQKLRKSKQTCEEIKKLYQIRAQIEEDYGERLLKLSQLDVGQSEEGTFAESISHIPSALETTARAHIDLAQQLQHHLEAPLDNFIKDQREVRKAQQQQIENSKQLKKLHQTNVVRAKDFYTGECMKLAGMEKYLRERGNGMSEDEKHQLQEDIEESRKMTTIAEQDYQRAMEVLKTVSEKWIDDWRATCDVFQEIEEKRMHYIRSSLWAFANMMSSVYIVDDQCCERIRTALELTDVQKDIETFLRDYGTGSFSPDRLYADNIHDANDSLRSAPVPQSSLDSSVNMNQTRSQSMDNLNKALPAVPLAVATNPDEELKSIDHQLQQLDHHSPSPKNDIEPSQITTPVSIHKNFAQSPDRDSPGQRSISYAFREIENMLGEDNAHGPHHETTPSHENAPAEPKADADAIIEEQDRSKDEEDASAVMMMVSPCSESSYDGQSTKNDGEKASQEPVPKPDNASLPLAAGTAVAAVAAATASGSEGAEETRRPASMVSQQSSEKNERFKPVPNPVFKKMQKKEIEAKRASSYESSEARPPTEEGEKRPSSMVELQPTGSDSRDIAAVPTPVPSIHIDKSGPRSIADDSSVTENQPPTTTHSVDRASPSSSNERSVTDLTVGDVQSAIDAKADAKADPQEANKNVKEPVKNENDTEKPTSQISVPRFTVGDADGQTESDDESENNYAIPAPPPKDEKWVISSIRRPQMVPVRVQNAQMYHGQGSLNGHSSAPRANLLQVAVPPSNHTTPSDPTIPVSSPDAPTQTTKPNRQRPGLKIDIPNSSKAPAINPAASQPNNARTAAQEVIAAGRAQSQNQPLTGDFQTPWQEQAYHQPSYHSNYSQSHRHPSFDGSDNPGIRAPPWQDDSMGAQDHMPPMQGAAPASFLSNMMQQPSNPHLSYDNRFAASNLYRNNSVTGPRAPRPESSVPPSELLHSHLHPSNGNVNGNINGNIHHHHQPPPPSGRQDFDFDNPSTHNTPKNGKSSKEFGKFMKGVLKPSSSSNEPSPAKTPNDPTSKQSNLIPPPSKSKEKGSRFSLGFLGNKKDKEKRSKETEQQQQQQQYQPQPQPQSQQRQQPSPTRLLLASTPSIHQREAVADMPATGAQKATAPPPISSPNPRHSTTEHRPSQDGARNSHQGCISDGRPIIEYVRAIWPFEASIPSEMTFMAGDVMAVVRKQSDGWWEAELTDPSRKQIGLIPGNYMEPV